MVTSIFLSVILSVNCTPFWAKTGKVANIKKAIRAGLIGGFGLGKIKSKYRIKAIEPSFYLIFVAWRESKNTT